MSESIIPSPKGPIRGKNLKFETINEDWNIYKLEDGTVLRVKIIAVNIIRGIDPETGDIFYIKERGEPLYNIRHQLVIASDVPKELLKEPPVESSTN